MKQRLWPAVAFAALALFGCGGGGGGSSGSGAPTASPAPPPEPIQTPPARPLINPNSANPTPGAPASSNPAASSARYALGTPDRWYMPGGRFERANDDYAVTASESLVYPNGVNLLHRRIQGAIAGRNQRFEMRLPSTAVREAWRDGWTGRGVNILVIDDFGLSTRAPTDNGNRHGYAVTMAIKEIAIGANYYSRNGGLSGSGLRYDAGGLRRMRDDRPVSIATRMDVINLSFGSDPRPEGTVFTRTSTRNYLRANRVLSDHLRGFDGSNTGDAVIVKGAGNDGVDAGRSLSNFAVLDDPYIGPRALLVGAISNRIRFCDESYCRVRTWGSANRPGADAKIRSRFLVAYAGSPVTDTVYLCDRDRSSCRNRRTMATKWSAGTSYATARVSGYAALVRHKFPNLSGAQTATILLDTATYQGIGSNPAIFGRGRVDIRRALSPIGGLR